MWRERFEGHLTTDYNDVGCVDDNHSWQFPHDSPALMTPQHRDVSLTAPTMTFTAV